MEHPDKEALIGRYLAAYNAFDMAGMLALLSRDVCFENYSAGRLTDAANGIDAFRELAERAKSLFSEREQRCTKLTHHQDSAIAEIAYGGTLALDIPGGPSAGTVLNLQGQSEFQFKNGQISKIIDRS